MIDKRAIFWSACNKIGIDNLSDLLPNMYNSGMSCNSISDYFLEKYNIKTSARNILDYIHKYGTVRTFKEAKNNAIKSGRMIYVKRIRNYKRPSINAKLRRTVLERDNFQCQICGLPAKNSGGLEIHHIEPLNNNIDKLQTLCKYCHEAI